MSLCAWKSGRVLFIFFVFHWFDLIYDFMNFSLLLIFCDLKKQYKRSEYIHSVGIFSLKRVTVYVQKSILKSAGKNVPYITLSFISQTSDIVFSSLLPYFYYLKLSSLLFFSVVSSFYIFAHINNENNFSFVRIERWRESVSHIYECFVFYFYFLYVLLFCFAISWK